MVTCFGSPPKSRDVALDPFESRELIHVAVVAAHFVGGLGRKGRMRKKTKPARPVIHADDHNALTG